MLHAIIGCEARICSSAEAGNEVDRHSQLRNRKNIAHPNAIGTLCSFQYVQLSSWITFTRDIETLDIGNESVFPCPQHAILANWLHDQSDLCNGVTCVKHSFNLQ